MQSGKRPPTSSDRVRLWTWRPFSLADRHWYNVTYLRKGCPNLLVVTQTLTATKTQQKKRRDVKWMMLIISGKLGCWESYTQPSAAEGWIKLMNQLQDLWRVCSMSCWHRGLLQFTKGGPRGLELCKLALCSWSTLPWFKSLNEDRSVFRTSCPWHVYPSLLTRSIAVW